MPPSNLPGTPAGNGYMLDNNQANWSYNAANIATVNGSMAGAAARQRGVNRRGGLPTGWSDQVGLGVPMQSSFSLNGSLIHTGYNDSVASDHGTAKSADPDQLIPTAIVIKNIPFAVRREHLADIMTAMNLPAPYAFNYHFDKGVFRGLAFANFSSPEDTRIVIDAMNGLEVHGRKLRVEYKKMLPDAERERIDREKRERRGQLEEQHRSPLHPQSSLQSLSSIAASQTTRTSPLRDIDLNDAQTLEFYTELTLFRRDDSREILIFPSTIMPEQRRQIHILAHHMGLEHQSVGDADNRQIHVIKRNVPSPTTLQNPSAVSAVGNRGLSRAATFDFAADRESRAASYNYSHAFGRHGPTLELPGSPDSTSIPNNLRTAKSFADLRSFSPSPSLSSSGYLNAANNGISSTSNITHFGAYGALAQPAIGTPNLTPTTSSNPGGPDASLISGLGGLNLGSIESNNVPRSTPGAIGSQRPGAIRPAAERPPISPDWDVAPGFATRRQNGHMQRGSDSSDSMTRATSSASRFA